MCCTSIIDCQSIPQLPTGRLGTTSIKITFISGIINLSIPSSKDSGSTEITVFSEVSLENLPVIVIMHYL